VDLVNCFSNQKLRNLTSKSAVYIVLVPFQLKNINPFSSYTVNRKKHQNVFDIRVYKLNLTDCDKIWYILS